MSLKNRVDRLQKAFLSTGSDLEIMTSIVGAIMDECSEYRPNGTVDNLVSQYQARGVDIDRIVSNFYKQIEGDN